MIKKTPQAPIFMNSSGRARGSRCSILFCSAIYSVRTRGSRTRTHTDARTNARVVGRTQKGRRKKKKYFLRRPAPDSNRRSDRYASPPRFLDAWSQARGSSNKANFAARRLPSCKESSGYNISGDGVRKVTSTALLRWATKACIWLAHV